MEDYDTIEYATYAPTGTDCTTCGRPIKGDEIARRRDGAESQSVYRHITCPGE